VWYTTTNIDQGAKILKTYQAKYPFIQDKQYRAGNEKLGQRIIQEARAGRLEADVIAIGIPEGPILKSRNIFLKYSSPEANAYPDYARNPDGYWMMWQMIPIVLGYNTKLVAQSEAPRSYEDLLKPRWKKNIGIDLQPYGWFVGALKVLEKKLGGQEKAISYFEKLAQQEPQYRSGHTLLNQLLAAGEFAVGPELRAHTLERLKQTGAPVDWIALDNTIIVQPHYLAISAQTLRPHAAALFVDFILSREGADVLREVRMVPTRADMSTEYLRGYKVTPVDSYGEREVKLFRDLMLKGQSR
jgi:iron(III) transport system substrate-binding protein